MQTGDQTASQPPFGATLASGFAKRGQAAATSAIDNRNIVFFKTALLDEFVMDGTISNNANTAQEL
jgi:hypothetical protein